MTVTVTVVAVGVAAKAATTALVLPGPPLPATAEGGHTIDMPTAGGPVHTPMAPMVDEATPAAV